jgi:hypothetical protein
LARLYQETIKQTLPSSREINSALGQIEIIAVLVEKLDGQNEAAKSTASALRALGKAITGESRATSPNGASKFEQSQMTAAGKPVARRSPQAKNAAVKKPTAAKTKTGRKPRKKRRTDT